MIRGETRVVVFNDSVTYDIPEKPKEFFKYFAEKLKRIPKEYRKDAVFEFESEESYGCSSINLCVSYTRQETDEEFENRKQIAKQRQEFKENQELCELERLKKKYSV